MSEITVDWKKVLAKILQELKIIDRGFNGTVEIDLKAGGVSTARRIEALN